MNREIARSELQGACRLAMALGYATGHADTYAQLVEHVQEQAAEKRRLWRAIARAAEAVELVVPEVEYPEQDILWLALDAARNAGLTWENDDALKERIR